MRREELLKNKSNSKNSLLCKLSVTPFGFTVIFTKSYPSARIILAQITQVARWASHKWPDGHHTNCHMGSTQIATWA